MLTPQFKPEDDEEKAELHQRRFAALQEAVKGAGMPVQLLLGDAVGFRFALAEAARCRAGWKRGCSSCAPPGSGPSWATPSANASLPATRGNSGACGSRTCSFRSTSAA